MTFTFNGTSDFISIPSTPELQLVKFSISLSFKTSKDYAAQGPGGEGILLMKGPWGGGGGEVSFGVWVSDKNHLRGGFETSDGTDHICTSTGMTYIDNVWHNVAITYDQIKVKMYIDGALYQKDGVFYGVHTTNAIPNTSNYLMRIGRNPWNNHPIGGWFKGQMKEIRIYNRPLTAPEVLNPPNDSTLVIKLL